MVRKLTECRIERNGNSLKVYRQGKYLGSISIEVIADALERKQDRQRKA